MEYIDCFELEKNGKDLMTFLSCKYHEDFDELIDLLQSKYSIYFNK